MQAIIHNIEPFDAAKGTLISFTWHGNQIFKVRCLIKTNKEGDTVYDTTLDVPADDDTDPIYDSTVNTMQSTFLIPANSGLENNGYYACFITVFDIENIESSPQDTGKPFYCFTTPDFRLSIEENAVIRASAYETSIIYSQAEDLPLESWNMTLYSYQQTAIQSSGTQYTESASLSYLVTGLENATSYYIKATGQTKHGMRLETKLIPFMASYTQAQIFNTLELNNLPDSGSIEIKANVIATSGIPEKDVIYIDGSKADLRDNSLLFDAGFEISGDFSQVIKLQNPVLNQRFMLMTDEESKMIIECYYREGSFDNSNGKKAVIELRASSISGLSYVLYSNYFNIPGPTETICFCLSRIGHYFNTKVLLE